MDARVNMMDFGTISSATPDIESESNRLIRTHPGLAKKLAWQVFSRVSSAIPVEDLIQIGQIALIEAARTFVDRGTAMFSSYATMRIRGAMIDELRKSATISRKSLRQRRIFGRAQSELQASLGRPPSEVEMADSVNMAMAAYRAAVSSMQTIEYTSIDDAYSDSSSWFADLAPAADEVLDTQRRRKSIADAISELPEREQVILQLYFVDECSLEEISKVFDVSAARICQIKRVALENMRGKLAQWRDS